MIKDSRTEKFLEEWRALFNTFNWERKIDRDCDIKEILECLEEMRKFYESLSDQVIDWKILALANTLVINFLS